MCELWCMMYDVWCMMYDVWCVMNDVWCMMYDVCDVWCVMCDVWLWCMMLMMYDYDVWCMMYDAIDTRTAVSAPHIHNACTTWFLSHTWHSHFYSAYRSLECMMYDVWCMMYDVWCTMYDVWWYAHIIYSVLQVIGRHIALVYAQGLMNTSISVYTITMLTFAAPALLLLLRCCGMMYDVWCMMYDVCVTCASCSSCFLCSLVDFLWCVCMDVWCLMCVCMMYDVWCMVCAVWWYDVWCVM